MTPDNTDKQLTSFFKTLNILLEANSLAVWALNKTSLNTANNIALLRSATTAAWLVDSEFRIEINTPCYYGNVIY